MSFLLHLQHFNLVPTQSPIFALGPDIYANLLSADYCISVSKLSLLFASNIVYYHSNVAKWEILGGPILKSFRPQSGCDGLSHSEEDTGESSVPA